MASKAIRLNWEISVILPKAVGIWGREPEAGSLEYSK
jgi:hypothetical protein